MIGMAMAIVRKNPEQILVCKSFAYKLGAPVWQLPQITFKKCVAVEDSLAQACYDNLGIKLSIQKIFMDVDCLYLHQSFHVLSFTSLIVEDHISWKELDMNEICDIRWIRLPDDFGQYHFSPASSMFISELMRIEKMETKNREQD